MKKNIVHLDVINEEEEYKDLGENLALVAAFGEQEVLLEKKDLIEINNNYDDSRQKLNQNIVDKMKKAADLPKEKAKEMSQLLINTKKFEMYLPDADDLHKVVNN